MLTMDAYVAARIKEEKVYKRIGYGIGDDINIYPEESPYIYKQTQETLSKLDLVLTVSSSLKKALEKKFEVKNKEVLVLYRGIDTRRLKKN